ncbi:MAG: peroxide stress protein YaaA [Acidobacteria bacterium]|nr:peroxide stress protein YaaA [Acidobacteriota bacterium]
MIILLPPSEGKAPGGTGIWQPGDGSFGPELERARRAVIRDLATASDAHLKVRGDLAIAARRTNLRIGKGPSLPAHQRYTGVVFQGLDVASLGGSEKKEALRSIVVVSGLLGLVRLADGVPEYRAPIDARTSRLGKLSQFWLDELTKTLQGLARRHVILDLLPQAHRAAVTATGDWRRIDLVSAQGVGGHAAKFAKGRLARWIIENGSDGLDRWRDDGWRVRVS